MKKNENTGVFNPGEIIVHVYGYDQTNCQFYEVVRSTTSTVWVRRMKKQVVPGTAGFLCHDSVPVKNEYEDDIVARHKLDFYDPYDVSVSFKYGSGHLWDGKPFTETFYH